ncbi:NADPH-dependent 2,4-dienoyl-CoA reductase/sulfur reductase-like enzyme [Bacillus pakistanensis]|uniref:NADPH-dependent 2,4-dienoyl-CoA reductase/sulfur reductase-like enzyme n=1 Tax=Rossellomorea pakistanensis TaxID=992288 RepID=A0ABS2NF74_9BACI|nr:CoA-disulfide reductase [Bacillus pakistanensis]MBM7586492.1 NADPH-dependent 2,4-dienoyl-CoA reductase/sulfur reductase-like enzyme [Bacillus pakistanensis]
MKQKILVIGGVAGGATTASQIRKLDKESTIIMFEKDEYISFGNCGMPYYIGDIITERDSLFAATPQSFKEKKNIEVRTRHEVIDINRPSKILTIKNLQTEELYEESYDKLLLAPGAYPFVPDLPGIGIIPSFTLRNIEDMDYIKQYINEHTPSSCAIVGGGFIGLEMAENFTQIGLDVHVIERSEQVMKMIDPSMAEHLHEHLKENGVHLLLNSSLEGIESDRTLKLSTGEQLKVDFLLFAVGVKPKVDLAEKAGLTIGETGGIVTNEFMQTNDPNIYAVGDAIQTFHFHLQTPKRVPLAWPAHRQSYIAAKHIAGEPVSFKGLLGTSIAKVFHLTVAATGLSEKALNQMEMEYKTVEHSGKSHAGYYPGAEYVYIRVHFNPLDGKIYGAQIVGGDGVDKRIDVIVTAIYGGIPVHELQALETSYSPPYSSPKDLLNIVGYKAEDMIQKTK